MSESQTYFDASPYVKLFVDKEGRWFQNGTEIIHPGIYRLFCDALEQGPDGGYLIKIGRESCRVEVEDTPFVVKAIRDTSQAGISLVLNDGTTEEFNPDNFWMSSDGIPYCKVKKGRFHARLLRPAYYALAQYVFEEDDSYYFSIDGNKFPVRYYAQRTQQAVAQD